MRLSWSRFTSALIRTPRTTLKMAALAPIPRARVTTTVSARPLARNSERRANLRSVSMVMSPSLLDRTHPLSLSARELLAKFLSLDDRPNLYFCRLSRHRLGAAHYPLHRLLHRVHLPDPEARDE